MKKSLSGLDLIAVTKELQAVVGSRIDKVYQPKKGELEISISTKGEGKSRLRVRLSGWVWLGKPKGEMPASPSSFASQLRKNISNARITAVSQHGCDRIIELSLQKENEVRLAFELFGDGNVILYSDEGIIALLRRKKMKHRELKPKEAYQYPPEAFDPRSSGKEGFQRVIAASSADMVRTLATKANLGGDYAEEICSRAGISKEMRASEADDALVGRIWKEVADLVRRLEGEGDPRIYFMDGAPIDVCPIELSSHAAEESKPFESFSDAIEEYIPRLPEEEPDEKAESGEMARLQRTLASQKEALLRLRPDIEAAQRTADLIFEKYAQVEGAIEGVRRGLAEGGLPADVEVVDKAKGRFRLSIGGAALVLSWKKNVTENAQEFYDSAKRLRGKVDGVEGAIRDTLVKIEALRKESLLNREKAAGKGRRAGSEWYERYRWFVSSEGALVIAGKDAKSNDQLVKKHLQPGDRYVHADIHGAPSAVVKKREGMTDASLKEAAIFSLAMSKAWNAGIGSGSAYWVTPEQVSKTPESGEFLAKGAWVIRGKRNYFQRLELRLAVGVCDLGRGPVAMCAPVAAVAKNCKGYIEIAPGKTPKETAAKEFAKRFSAGIDEMQSILPPGGIEIVAEKKA